MQTNEIKVTTISHWVDESDAQTDAPSKEGGRRRDGTGKTGGTINITLKSMQTRQFVVSYHQNHRWIQCPRGDAPSKEEMAQVKLGVP